jgi:protein O-GlcNAc transferase
MPDESSIETSLSNIDEQVRSDQILAAESSCLDLVQRAPHEPRAWFQLGAIRLKIGRFPEAEADLRKAIEIDPSQASYWNLLATSLFQQKRWEEAVHPFGQVVDLNPQDASAWSSLAATLWAIGDLAAADEAYQRSLQITSEHLPTQNNYARLLLERGKAQQALSVLEEVLARDSTMVTAWLALGNAHLNRGDHNQAALAFQRALNLTPGNREIRRGVVEALIRNAPPAAAEPVVQQFMADEQQSAEAWTLLALLRHKQFRNAEAADALRNALILMPNPVQHSSLLNMLQYGDGATADKLLVAHRQWDAGYAAPLYPDLPPAVHLHAGNQPIRIGFVSSDFGRHPIGFMVLPVLEHLDKARCTVLCYSDRSDEDELTARFQAATDTWRFSGQMSDEELANQIRKDRIDILFDLMGHNGKRLLAFARKPAPLQVTWFGYVGTTGMRAMDFLLADRFHVCPGEEIHYAESILRMPNGYACYGPPAESPEVGPLPAIETGHVTFGCLNNPEKFSPRTIDAWSKILNRVPNARLLLKYRGLEHDEIQDRIKVEFAQRMIGPSRIRIEGGSPHQEHLEAYHRVDLALDTLPYSGGLTTCESLWMGVPVITCPGKTFASRHSMSHLTNAGYPEFVAPDPKGYIELAVRWASRLDELAVIRSQMRDRVRQSPLCDAPRFAHDFLSLLYQAWESCIESSGARAI